MNEPKVAWGWTLLGAAVLWAAAVPVGFAFFLDTEPNRVGTALLAGLALLGLALGVFGRLRAKVQGFGLGLLAGWALLTVITGGACTGLF